MIDTMKEIEADWEQHPAVVAAKAAENQATAALTEATQARQECGAWKHSADPFQQLRYRVEYPALDLAEDRCKVDLFKAQEARKDIEREAKVRVQPVWDQRFREAWLAIEQAASGPLFDAVSQWERLVETKASGVTVPIGLPAEWHSHAIRTIVAWARAQLHLDDR